MFLRRQALLLIPVAWIIIAFLAFTYKESVHLEEPQTHRSFTSQKLSPLSRITLDSDKELKEMSSKQCQFPFFSAFHPVAMAYMQKLEHPPCQYKRLSSMVVVEGNTLKMTSDLISEKLKETAPTVCSYFSFQRSPVSDYELYFKSSATYFQDWVKLQPRDENVRVNCFDSSSNLVSSGYLSVIAEDEPTQILKTKKYKRHVQRHKPNRTLSVILLGVDSMSKQNFERTMPKTREFLLESLGALEFYKYSVVGYETFRNLMPILAGYEEIDLENQSKFSNTFNSSINYIWNSYQKAGYRTQIVLDRKNITTFHWKKRGFSKKPGDFYNRPVVIISDEEDNSAYGEYCIGDTPATVYHLDYIMRMASTFNNSITPYFTFAFLASLTHDDMNMASAGDGFFASFFESLHEKMLLQNTVIVFFSDHGTRLGPFRETYFGMLEERMPFLFLILPPWFRLAYPALFRVLNHNQDQLTTPFDVHQTLLDILYFDGNVKENDPFARGNSLLREISASRTCEAAGIGQHWCMCRDLLEAHFESTDLIKYMGLKMLNKIESILYFVRDLCLPLGLKEIKKAYVVSPRLKDSGTVYHLVIETSNNGGLYEGTLSVDNLTGVPNAEVLEIVRINKYTGQGDCMKDPKLMPFCYCLNKLEE